MTVPAHPPIATLPTAPSRQRPTTFSAESDAFFAQMQPLADDQNALATWMESTANSAEGWANDAEASATASEVSRQAAAAVANYKGDWASLTGALNKPATVSNDGAFWALNNNLANVALSEPAPGNADWSFVSGTRWVTFTATGSLSANMMAAVTATTANVDLTMPTFAANDFLIVSNDSVSTYQVRVLNSSCTIRSVNFTASPGGNIILAPGETMHLRAVSPTILEVVQNG